MRVGKQKNIQRFGGTNFWKFYSQTSKCVLGDWILRPSNLRQIARASESIAMKK